MSYATFDTFLSFVTYIGNFSAKEAKFWLGSIFLHTRKISSDWLNIHIWLEIISHS